MRYFTKQQKFYFRFLALHIVRINSYCGQ